MTSTLKFFIPRIATDVSKDTIKRTFEKLLIGSICEIDMYLKKSRKGQAYWYAFAAVELFPTSCANAITRQLEEKGSAKIVYDEPEFLEIKSYIPKEERVTTKNDIKSICDELSTPPLPVMNMEWLEDSIYLPNYYWDLPSVRKEMISLPSFYNKEEGEILEKEYQKLEKEIYSCCY